MQSSYDLLYTQKFLGAFGYVFEDYEQKQEWMQEGIEEGIEENLEKIQDIYKYEIKLHTIYASFHGKIVEYTKRFIRGKHVDITLITQAMEGET